MSLGEFIIFLCMLIVCVLIGISIGRDEGKRKVYQDAIAANAGRYVANPTNGVTEFIFDKN